MSRTGNTNIKYDLRNFCRRDLYGSHTYLIADLLCTVDERKAFHARAMGLGLVPDHPMSTMEDDLMALFESPPQNVAQDQDGFCFDGRGYDGKCAWKDR